MNINTPDESCITALEKRISAAYVYVFNRHNELDFSSAYEFLRYTEEQIKYIKR